VTTPIVVSDMDGTLATADTWRGVHAWILANHPSRAARWFIRARLHRVAVAKAGLTDVEAFKARWLEDQAALLRGLPAGRLDDLASWTVERHLWPSRRQGALDAVAAATAEARVAHPGARLVLATGAFQPVADAFARRVGADAALGTPVEVRDGVLTGRLLRRTQTGDAKAAAVLEAAAGGDVLVAFGDTAADVPMLRLAARAVAVAPDKALRREAAARGWEVLEA
jgi:phosphoserine phosphatase